MVVPNEEVIRRLRAFKGTGTNLSRTAANRVERLQARIDATHKLVTSLFWDGAIDQDDAQKLHAALRGAGEG